MPTLKCIDRANAEVAAGRAWRAKEILRGNIGNLGYHPDLFEAYGRVLLESRDDMEAGRFLFLSGSRKEEYSQAIFLYLGRYGKNWANLIGTFPYAARLQQRDDYPKPVAEFLHQLGAPAKFKSYWNSAELRIASQSGGNVLGWSLGCGLVSAVGAFLITALVLALVRSVPMAFGIVPWWLWPAVGVVAAIWYAVKNRR